MAACHTIQDGGINVGRVYTKDTKNRSNQTDKIGPRSHLKNHLAIRLNYRNQFMCSLGRGSKFLNFYHWIISDPNESP